ncbi:efflux RND transporter permease subunit [Kiritimatiella glycovorans]|uniref:Multidrug transporter MdtC n=1 Tax=Kiritimatiella glycovorans TaxID=1307763 RepID=A0A0G3EIQ0_9BACT|nr:efflux RND transporter permease subunit [Kiritimatiella glycovorans]AKJ64034.1 Multidrug transporter MdtC [Kiritimatiella glycovorans]
MILSNYAIKFRTAVFVFIVVLVALGAVSYVTLPREGYPDITISQVFVTAVYEGTAPADMEDLITIPVEKKLDELGNVKEIQSVSADSVSTIVIEFLPDVDIDTAIQRVKDKIDLARPDLPDDLDEPVVEGFNLSTDVPVMRFALSGDDDLARLKSVAEHLQEELERIPALHEARITGAREREIRVEFDPARMAVLGVGIGTVFERIEGENVTISAGNLEVAGHKFQVRVPGEFELPSRIEELILKTVRGRPVFLHDIAEVRDTYKDRTSIARLNGKPAVSIEITKRAGENTVGLIEEVQHVLETYTLPPDLEVTVVQDDSEHIHDMLSELENNIGSGFLLVIIVLCLFMGGRNSVFVGAAIPMSMLLTFMIMALLGLTLNMVVLFALILAVGMLVDNGIVIVENIYRLHCEGLSRLEAARRGASEVAWPVATSTLTTLAAFSPLLFWPDIIGEFMKFMPQTLIITLASSLFVALIINPAVCSVFIKADGRRDPHQEARRHPFVLGYEHLLRKALRCRAPVVVTGLLFLVLSVQLYERYGRGIILFPDVEPRFAQVEVKYPEGTQIEKTDATLRRIEGLVKDLPDIEFILSNAGQGTGEVIGGESEGTHLGSLYIEFVDEEERTTDTNLLVDRIRGRIPRAPGMDLKVTGEQAGPPREPPVSIELSGEDLDLLSSLARDVRRRISSVPGLVDLRMDYEDALPEFRFRVDRQRARLLELDTRGVGTFLRSSLYGIELRNEFRADEDEYEITVRMPEDQRDAFDYLDRIYVPRPDRPPVPLSSLGRFEYTAGQGIIRRKDLDRVITITGENEGRESEAILQDIIPIVDDMNFPSGYSVRYTGEKEDQQESGAFLSKAFGMALAGIVVILVIQFNSAVLPFIIMLTVALSTIGVCWGLLITREYFSIIMTGVGIISLAGIVVNNAIVLIDCINQQRSEKPVTEAIVRAGTLRLRPVLLTAATTILGLIPMAVGYSFEVHRFPPMLVEGGATSSFWAPMAIAVIFGLAVSTVLTLVLVPVLYSLADSLAERFRR